MPNNNILLFLDIDGVLNDHRKTSTNYTNICEERCKILNVLLNSFPNLKIIISSAWRYLILNNDMTLKGFEYMLLKSGLQCHGRVLGCTGRDPSGEVSHHDAEAWYTASLRYRSGQIQDYVFEAGFPEYIVLDDLPLTIPNLVQTNGQVGITYKDVNNAINLINNL